MPRKKPMDVVTTRWSPSRTHRRQVNTMIIQTGALPKIRATMRVMQGSMDVSISCLKKVLKMFLKRKVMIIPWMNMASPCLQSV